MGPFLPDWAEQETEKSYFICIRHIYFLRCCWNTHLLSSIGTISVTGFYHFPVSHRMIPRDHSVFQDADPQKNLLLVVYLEQTKPLFFFFFFPGSFKQHWHIDCSSGTIEIPCFMAGSTLPKTDIQEKLLSSCEIITCSLIKKLCFQKHVMLVGNSTLPKNALYFTQNTVGSFWWDSVLIVVLGLFYFLMLFRLPNRLKKDVVRSYSSHAHSSLFKNQIFLRFLYWR